MKLKNKVLVVTGAGNGMGREVTLLLLKMGNKVAAVDLNESYLKETFQLAGEFAQNLKLFPMDIADKDAVFALPEKVMQAFAQVDGIMNIAGIIQPFVPIVDLNESIIDKVMEVNFYGTLNMCRAFLPHLLKRQEAHVLNVSSMGGFLPVPGQSIYGASKAAVKLFTEGLCSELSQTSVGVTLVMPGGVGTDITKNSGVNVPQTEQSNYKTVSPQKAAAIMVESIEKNKFRVLIGSDASFMDKLQRFSPEYARKFILKKMAFLLKNK